MAQDSVTEPLWTLSGPPQPVVAGTSFRVTATVKLPLGYYQDVDSPFLSFEPNQAAVVDRSSSPPTIRKEKRSFTGTFTLTRTVVLPEGTPPGPRNLVWKTGWQICQVDGVCLLPAERSFTLAVIVTGAGGPAAPLPGLDFWGALLGAFLGGLILNLMPCVFPVLALKAVGLGSASGLSFKERRREALAFAAGGWGTLTLLGVATAIFSAVGQRLDWGFSFQEPLFVGALALVFWVFALQLWGVWTWNGSPFTLTTSAKPHWGRSLAGGALLVVAAAPCTAPFLGPALGFALAQPPMVIPWFFAAAGLGLVMPLLVVQSFPAWGKLLPKPGPWMVVMERVAGFFLATTVLYLLWVWTKQTSEQAVWPGLAALGMVAGALAWAGRFPKSLVVRVLACVLGMGSALAVPVLVGSMGPVPTRVSSGWQDFSPTALAQALAAGRPVLVDATAAWCATCQVNELAVLDRADVTALFDRLGLVRLRADYTRPDPVIRAWLASVNRAGLPVYALYRPGRDPYLFPELLTDDNFTRVLALEPRSQGISPLSIPRTFR